MLASCALLSSASTAALTFSKRFAGRGEQVRHARRRLELDPERSRVAAGNREDDGREGLTATSHGRTAGRVVAEPVMTLFSAERHRRYGPPRFALNVASTYEATSIALSQDTLGQSHRLVDLLCTQRATLFFENRCFPRHELRADWPTTGGFVRGALQMIVKIRICIRAHMIRRGCRGARPTFSQGFGNPGECVDRPGTPESFPRTHSRG